MKPILIPTHSTTDTVKGRKIVAPQANLVIPVGAPSDNGSDGEAYDSMYTPSPQPPDPRPPATGEKIHYPNSKIPPNCKTLIVVLGYLLNPDGSAHIWLKQRIDTAMDVYNTHRRKLIEEKKRAARARVSKRKNKSNSTSNSASSTMAHNSGAATPVPLPTEQERRQMKTKEVSSRLDSYLNSTTQTQKKTTNNELEKKTDTDTDASERKNESENENKDNQKDEEKNKTVSRLPVIDDEKQHKENSEIVFEKRNLVSNNSNSSVTKDKENGKQLAIANNTKRSKTTGRYLVSDSGTTTVHSMSNISYAPSIQSTTKTHNEFIQESVDITNTNTQDGIPTIVYQVSDMDGNGGRSGSDSDNDADNDDDDNENDDVDININDDELGIFFVGSGSDLSNKLNDYQTNHFTEGQFIANYLQTEYNISPHLLLCENNAKHSGDNFMQIFKMLYESNFCRNITYHEKESQNTLDYLFFITSNFHVPRIQMIFDIVFTYIDPKKKWERANYRRKQRAQNKARESKVAKSNKVNGENINGENGNNNNNNGGENENKQEENNNKNEEEDDGEDDGEDDDLLKLYNDRPQNVSSKEPWCKVNKSVEVIGVKQDRKVGLKLIEQEKVKCKSRKRKKMVEGHNYDIWQWRFDIEKTDLDAKRRYEQLLLQKYKSKQSQHVNNSLTAEAIQMLTAMNVNPPPHYNGSPGSGESTTARLVGNVFHQYEPSGDGASQGGSGAVTPANVAEKLMLNIPPNMFAGGIGGIGGSGNGISGGSGGSGSGSSILRADSQSRSRSQSFGSQSSSGYYSSQSDRESTVDIGFEDSHSVYTQESSTDVSDIDRLNESDNDNTDSINSKSKTSENSKKGLRKSSIKLRRFSRNRDKNSKMKQNKNETTSSEDENNNNNKNKTKNKNGNKIKTKNGNKNKNQSKNNKNSKQKENEKSSKNRSNSNMKKQKNKSEQKNEDIDEEVVTAPNGCCIIL